MPGPRRDKSEAWLRLEKSLETLGVISDLPEALAMRGPAVQPKHRVAMILQRLIASGRFDRAQIDLLRALLVEVIVAKCVSMLGREIRQG